MDRLTNTDEASAASGLSPYELRRGWKEGRYPALAIGGKDNRQVRLRWNIPLLLATIEQQMKQQVEV